MGKTLPWSFWASSKRTAETGVTRRRFCLWGKISAGTSTRTGHVRTDVWTMESSNVTVTCPAPDSFLWATSSRRLTGSGLVSVGLNTAHNKPQFIYEEVDDSLVLCKMNCQDAQACCCDSVKECNMRISSTFCLWQKTGSHTAICIHFLHMFLATKNRSVVLMSARRCGVVVCFLRCSCREPCRGGSTSAGRRRTQRHRSPAGTTCSGSSDPEPEQKHLLLPTSSEFPSYRFFVFLTITRTEVQWVTDPVFICRGGETSSGERWSRRWGRESASSIFPRSRWSLLSVSPWWRGCVNVPRIYWETCLTPCCSTSHQGWGTRELSNLLGKRKVLKPVLLDCLLLREDHTFQKKGKGE